MLGLEHMLDSRITRKRIDLSCWWQLAATTLCDSPRERECRSYKEDYHDQKTINSFPRFCDRSDSIWTSSSWKKEADQTPDKIKAEVESRLNKKEEHVKVKLRSGSEVKGRITQTSDTGFTVIDDKTGVAPKLPTLTYRTLKAEA